MNKEPARIVYVRFDGLRKGKIGERLSIDGNGLTQVTRVGPAVVEGEQEKERQAAPGLTMSATFSFREVAKLFDISDGRLRYWDSSGFIQPSGYNGRYRCFTFQDLISIRSAKALLDNGLSLQRTRKIIADLKDKLPKTTHPLGRLRIMSDAKTVVVVDEDHEFDADTGQILLDFNTRSIEDSIVAELPSRKRDVENRSAYEWYLEGCRLDENEEMLQQAEEAYHRAIYMDPSLANAYTNLGNLRYRQGAVKDAKILYTKAIEVDVNQPEAHYNLGFLEFEDGELQKASVCFTKAVELDPTFADAHFNLAMTLFRLDLDELARTHWKRYLALEPTGPWADIARRRLQEVN